MIRFTCADLEAAGMAMRFAVGGVLWWNPDYAHYHFLEQQPGYDHYLFVEYDCVVQCSLERFVARAISQDAGLVALPISRTFEQWHWTPYQRDVYPAGQNKLALLNVSLYSSAALKLLHQRRLAMNVDPSVVSWPSSELFVPSEIVRAGMKWISLADFGDVSNYDWFPPTMEDDLRPGQGDTFLHPVLDRRRYIVSLLQNKGSLPAGELKQSTRSFSPRGICEAHLAGGPEGRCKADPAQDHPVASTDGLAICEGKPRSQKRDLGHPLKWTKELSACS